VALAVVTGVLHPTFFRPGELFSTLQGAVYVGIIAGGIGFLLSMRELDLSVGSGFGLCLIAMGIMMKHGISPWLACLFGILLGAVLGLVNALVVQVVGIPTIIATLANLSVYRGLALALASGNQVTLPARMTTGSSFFTFLGGDTWLIPNSVFVMIAVAIVLTVILRFTPFGYRVRSIGSNPDAATFSGISIPRVRMQVLIMVGVLVGISAACGLAFFTSGDPNIGTGFELQAIAAAVIGGTALRGGNTTVAGSVLGAVLLSVVTSALSFFSVPATWSTFATGAAILLAVSLDSLLRRRRRRKEAELGL
jgi:ribose transport system permease protein